MSKAVRSLAGERIRELIPLRRIGTPEEVAAVVLFWLATTPDTSPAKWSAWTVALSLGGIGERTIAWRGKYPSGRNMLDRCINGPERRSER